MADRDSSADSRERELERYESIVQSLGDPVCTFDTDGRFVYVNDAFETELGYDRDRARGSELTLVASDVDAEHITSLATELRAADERTTETVEMGIQTREDGTMPTECHVATLPAGEDDSSETVVVFRDISRRKQREQRLTKLASVVAHDLRNPMDVALGRAEVLPDIADVDAETEKHLDEIFDALKRMEQLIDEVLTLSRQSAEVVEVSTVSLETIAQEAWGNVDTASATLTVIDDGEMRANRSRLLRLLENLFRNAVEHAGNDVSVEVGPLDTRWETAETGFYVADDGPGIPEDQRDDIFEDGFSTSRDGTGLGLSIVRDTATAHGWSVTLAESNGGARFEITGISLPEP